MAPSMLFKRSAEGFAQVTTASELFNARVLELTGEVSREACAELVRALLVLEREDPEAEVTLLVSSQGGDVYAGLALIDVMADVSCPVRTVGMGCVASMASVILACGDSRACYPHTHVLLHQPLSGSGLVQQSDFDIAAAHLSAVRGELEALLAKRCGLDEAEVHRLCERDCWLGARQALELGIVDEVVGVA